MNCCRFLSKSGEESKLKKIFLKTFETNMFLFFATFIQVLLAQQDIPAPEMPQPPSVWGKDNINLYPNVLDSPLACNRGQSSLVCDPNESQSRQKLDELDIELAKLRNLSGICPCPHGCHQEDVKTYTGVLAVINILGATHPKSGFEVLQLYAETYIKHWTITDCQDNVVIFMSAQSNLSTMNFGRKSTFSLVCRDRLKRESSFITKPGIEGLFSLVLLLSDIASGKRNCSGPFVSSNPCSLIAANFAAIVISVVFSLAI